jgi:nucleotide-binding universal stress UspA family protein
MTDRKPKARIENVLCPTDLLDKSQKALGFATRLAETLQARLTVCHCAPADWFGTENRLPKEEYERVKSAIEQQITACQAPDSTLRWRSLVIENSFDPAREVVDLASEMNADLIVMKARPGILSALRFGSIVERIIEGSPCPVLLLPSRFLAERDPKPEALEFRRILFDYDFSEATDQLFHVANALTRDYRADLEVLSVIEPSRNAATEAAPIAFSRSSVRNIVRGRLMEALRAEGKSITEVPTSVEWGEHAKTVLQYAKGLEVDLICTALAPPDFYFEKLYRAYLGSLLKSAEFPILVKQSTASQKVKDLN